MKKVILSRKGFDSGSGGLPSPIFPDGKMLSLPIPDKQSPIRYQDIKWNEYDLGTIVSDLTKRRIPSFYGAHLDPDIDPQSLKRHQSWKPLLGQIKAAQGHLNNQNVQAGDIFLFYGLFRRVAMDAHLNFNSEESPIHVIWGWLQIDKIITIDSCNKEELKWAIYHPHFHRESDRTNTIYIAKENIEIPGMDSNDISGAGIFRYYDSGLRLTKPGSNKSSLWQLPEWMYPTSEKKPMTYHSDKKRWKKSDGSVLLDTVGRGQEFVLDCQDYPELREWTEQILRIQREYMR